MFPPPSPPHEPAPEGDCFGGIAVTTGKAAAPSESCRGPYTAAIDRCLRGRRIIPSSSGRIRVALTLAGGLSIVWICRRLLFLVSVAFCLASLAGGKYEEEKGVEGCLARVGDGGKKTGMVLGGGSSP